jgi:predicted AAA+ superfamily ATPase
MDDLEFILPRGLESALQEAMTDTPVVCLLGPRQCGKSTLARTLDASRQYLSLDDVDLLAAAKRDPKGFIGQWQGNITLDEIQRAPELLLTIKRAVDENRRPGRFLLTGSANLLQLPHLPDSLAGRMECLYLHTLTEAEKARSEGLFLSKLLTGKLLESSSFREDRMMPSSLPGRIVAGGYPEPQGRLPVRARQWHRQYLSSVIDRDVHDVARVRDSREIARLLEILAHQTGNLLNTSSLANDLQLDRQTVERYLAVLERLFLVRRLPPWHRNAAKRLIKTPKIHLVDSGVAASLAGISSGDWLTRREKFGHLLESFILQQLSAQAGWTDPDLRFWHYRDKDQVEVDVVLTRGNKVWGVEIKASASLHHSDGNGLRRLAAQCGNDFQSGIIFYDGATILQLDGPKILAVPIHLLWEW